MRPAQFVFVSPANCSDCEANRRGLGELVNSLVAFSR